MTSHQHNAVASYCAGVISGVIVAVLVLWASKPNDQPQPSTADLARWQHSVDARLMKQHKRIMRLESK